MPLSPHPQADPITGGANQAAFAWSQWFNALRALVNTDTARLTVIEAQLAALEARVAALEAP